MSIRTTNLRQESTFQPAAEQRYVALDAYRGFIMILLASGGFGFAALAHHPTYGRIAAWFDHVPWEGAVFWDLVQPAFMFMVGVAMSLAVGRQKERGAGFTQALGRVASRSVKLILLSQLLEWMATGKLEFQFINILSQIAFTYFFCFLIMQLRFRWQALGAVVILTGLRLLLWGFRAPTDRFLKRRTLGP